MQLDISATTGRPYAPFLRQQLLRARQFFPSRLTSLSLALVGNARMAQLHQEFLNIPGPTDVLTFELDHDSRGRVTAGEIVICVPYAARQARKSGIPVRHELLLYAIHGLLHLTGFDDLTDDGYRKMHRKEDEILRRLGIGAVFAPGQSPQISRKANRGAGK
jgi:rRNA maturation RNase YbeY